MDKLIFGNFPWVSCAASSSSKLWSQQVFNSITELQLNVIQLASTSDMDFVQVQGRVGMLPFKWTTSSSPVCFCFLNGNFCWRWFWFVWLRFFAFVFTTIMVKSLFILSFSLVQRNTFIRIKFKQLRQRQNFISYWHRILNYFLMPLTNISFDWITSNIYLVYVMGKSFRILDLSLIFVEIKGSIHIIAGKFSLGCNVDIDSNAFHLRNAFPVILNLLDGSSSKHYFVNKVGSKLSNKFIPVVSVIRVVNPLPEIFRYLSWLEKVE